MNPNLKRSRVKSLRAEEGEPETEDEDTNYYSCVVTYYNSTPSDAHAFRAQERTPGPSSVNMSDDKGFSLVLSRSSSGIEANYGERQRNGGRPRLWPTTISSFVAAIPALLVGYTIGFASPALPDLTGESSGAIPSNYVFSSSLADLFAVSVVREREGFLSFTAGAGSSGRCIRRASRWSHLGQMGTQERPGAVRCTIFRGIFDAHLRSSSAHSNQFQGSRSVRQISDWCGNGLGLHGCLGKSKPCFPYSVVQIYVFNLAL